MQCCSHTTLSRINWISSCTPAMEHHLSLTIMLRYNRTTPHHTTPHCTAPHHTSLHRTTPHCTAPHRTTPHHTAQHQTEPRYIVGVLNNVNLRYTSLHNSAHHCTTSSHCTIQQQIVQHNEIKTTLHPFPPHIGCHWSADFTKSSSTYTCKHVRTCRFLNTLCRARVMEFANTYTDVW